MALPFFGQEDSHGFYSRPYRSFWHRGVNDLRGSIERISIDDGSDVLAQAINRNGFSE